MFLPPVRALVLSPLSADAGGDDVDGQDQVLYLVVAAALVLFGGIFAGLTLALMGQDEIYLNVLTKSGDGNEPRQAQKVLDLLQKGKHWLLVTLLLSNVITNETLPIMLDRSLGGGWQAVVGSTVLIVIFGEIVPQSFCARYGLQAGAFMAPFVSLLMWALAPVAWPIAKLLDYILGEDHGTTYKKEGLKTLVTLHRSMGSNPQERLTKDEVTIITAVLDLKQKCVGEVMVPMSDVFTLSDDVILDEKMMIKILREGYSRIPVHRKDNNHDFVGMLLVKMLVPYDPSHPIPVGKFHLATLPECRPETCCLDILNFFQKGKSHMVLVSEYPGDSRGALGVLTLEDVIEELIGEEIIDESDVFVDVQKAIRRRNPPRYNQLSLFQAIKRGSETPVPTSPARLPSDATAENVEPSSSKSNLRRNSGAIITNAHAEQKVPPARLRPSNSAFNPNPSTLSSIHIKPASMNPSTADNSTSAVTKPDAESQPSSPANSRKPSSVTRAETSPPSTPKSRKPSSASIKAAEVLERAVETTGLLSAGRTASDAVQAIGYGSLKEASPTQKFQAAEPLSAVTKSPLSLSPRPASPPKITITDPNPSTKADTRTAPNLPAKMIISPNPDPSFSSDDEDRLSAIHRSNSQASAASNSLSPAISGDIVERRVENGKVVLDVMDPDGHRGSYDEVLDSTENTSLLSATAQPVNGDEDQDKLKPNQDKSKVFKRNRGRRFFQAKSANSK